MEISIRQIQIPKGHRILAVSDIHGHKTFLQNLLNQAEFSDHDTLFIVGDIIEKGCENLASLWYVMELAQRDNVVVLLGNVDLARLQMIENLTEETCDKFYQYLLYIRSRGWKSIFDEMAKELGIILDSPKQVLASKSSLLTEFQKEWDFIRHLPAIATAGKYIFVHGGLPCEDLETVKDQNIRQVLKFDHFMTEGLSFNNYVVVGHWPVSIYNDHILQTNPILNRRRHIISIDGGCGIHREGQLNLLMIPGIDCPVDQILSASWDQLPVFEAVTPQRESDSSVNIHFVNPKVRILKEEGEFCLAEHLDSGRNLKVLTRYLYNREGEWACVRYTDYHIPIKPGDLVSLVDQSSEEYLVKKDGVCGWYQGELRAPSVQSIKRGFVKCSISSL